MHLTNLPLIAGLARTVARLGERQNAQPVAASIDTPHYRASDLRPLRFRHALAQSAAHLELGATSPSREPMLSDRSGMPSRAMERNFAREIEGNALQVEHGTVKKAPESADGQRMMKLYRKPMAMPRQATGS